MDDCEQKFKRLRRCNNNNPSVHHHDQQSSSNWPDLPIGPLFEIMDKLIFADDYVRFGAVCVSWRNAYKFSFKTSTSLPLLLIPPHSYQEEEKEKNNNKLYKEEATKIPQTCSLYNVVTKHVCSNFQVTLPQDKYCRGSSFGWLINMSTTTIRKGTNNYIICYVQLLNPFLSDKHNIINTPPMYNKLLRHDHDMSYYLRKAVLSSDPIFTPKDFVVMAIMTEFCKLVFYTPINKDWTPVSWESQVWRYFADVIYFNKTQQFYAVLRNMGEVVAIDLIKTQKGPIVPKLTIFTPPIPADKYGWFKRYLVETCTGELLQVVKIYSSGLWFEKTARFEVFKFDPVGHVWIQICDIGDSVLFLGANSSICRSASDLPGCKSNCIYYTDDVNFEYRGHPYGLQDAGIYNLEDGSVEQHHPLASRFMAGEGTASWFEAYASQKVIFPPRVCTSDDDSRASSASIALEVISFKNRQTRVVLHKKKAT